MKIALAGDAHGNLHALNAVLTATALHGAERLLFTGDFVGYYYEGAAVVRALRNADAICVRGNHDDMIAACESSQLAADAVAAKYGHGVDRAIQELQREEKDWLAALPVSRMATIDGRRILLAHGTATNNTDYLYPDAPDLLDRIGAADFDIAVLGHTHYRMRQTFRDQIVLNPGSVGQPRDRIPGAAWCLLDTETGESQFLTETYDRDAVARQAREVDPQLPYLWTVLDRT